MSNTWNYGDPYFNGDSYKTRAQAFAAARKNGSGVFTYKGKQYNTMQKGENADDFRKNHADYDYFLGNVDSNLGGWKPSSPVQTSYKVNNVPTEVTYDLPEVSGIARRINPRLEMFTNDDIRNLGFRNYSGLISAVGNLANANNNFVKALINRYGADTSKWNLDTIENDLGVKGTYRSFGNGDFGDMSRAMADWVGKNNGEIDRKNLLDRTGSDNIVYSSKNVRDLFDMHPVKPNTFTFDTSSFGQNIFGTPKRQQGGQLNMNEQQLQLAFLQYLMLKTGVQNEQQLELVMQQMGEEGLKLAYAQFMQEMLQQQVQAAKFGAKLNYIKRLNGLCPEGTELRYYKVGGRLCKKCMLAKLNSTEESSDPIKAFKCGRKIKKHLQGGSFKQAFDNAYGKQRYFTYKGKVYAAYKGNKATDQGFQGAVDNLQEQANALNDYNAGTHLGWDPGANKHANFRHDRSGTMIGVLPEITVTAKRKTSRQPILTSRNTDTGWTTTAGQSRMGELAGRQSNMNNSKYMFGASNPFENMVAQTKSAFDLDSDWRKDIKTWRDPNTGKSYLYVTRDGINYLSNGRYWNPTTKRGGNYSWTPGWKMFGGGFHYN